MERKDLFVFKCVLAARIRPEELTLALTDHSTLAMRGHQSQCLSDSSLLCLLLCLHWWTCILTSIGASCCTTLLAILISASSASDSSPIDRRGCSSVYEDVVLRQFLNVLLNLLHFLLKVDLAWLLAERVELRVMCFLLVLDVEDFPLFLEGSDQLRALFLRHQVLPAVLFSLLFNLHLTD